MRRKKCRMEKIRQTFAELENKLAVAAKHSEAFTNQVDQAETLFTNKCYSASFELLTVVRSSSQYPEAVPERETLSVSTKSS